MHITTFFSVLAAATLAVAAPQSSSLNDLPACAQQAGLASIDATGCDLTDIKCICSSVPFISTLRSYIEAHCTASDQAAALTYGQNLCAPYGVTFSATVPGVTATPGAVSDVAPVATMAPAGTATSTINPTDAAMGITATGSSYQSAAPTASLNTTLLPYTGAASSAFVYEMAMVLAGAAGVAAFIL